VGHAVALAGRMICLAQRELTVRHFEVDVRVPG
jgi:hypothetical protein